MKWRKKVEKNILWCYMYVYVQHCRKASLLRSTVKENFFFSQWIINLYLKMWWNIERKITQIKGRIRENNNLIQGNPFFRLFCEDDSKKGFTFPNRKSVLGCRVGWPKKFMENVSYRWSQSASMILNWFLG